MCSISIYVANNHLSPTILSISLRNVLDPNGVLTGCLGRATLALPILLDRLVRDTIRLVGSAVAAQVLVADRAAFFPIVCALLR